MKMHGLAITAGWLSVCQTTYLAAVVIGALVGLFLAVAYRPYPTPPKAADPAQPPAQLYVTALVTLYNEDPAILQAALRSLVAQRRRIDQVHVIDDCSHDKAGLAAARELAALFAKHGIDYQISENPRNLGKRKALSRGIEQSPRADVFLSIDSDTILAPDAVGALLAPFSDPTVTAAAALVLPAKPGWSPLRLLQELQYASLFTKRAAQTRLGSALSCCGALAAYRADIMRENLTDYVTQTYLGRPALTGEDLRIGNYCLRRGRVVYQESAVGYTVVPERWSHFIRQQARWARSFQRESLWALRRQSPRKLAFWVYVFELCGWICPFACLTIGQLTSALGYTAAAFALLMYLKAVRYPRMPRQDENSWRTFTIFLLAPVLGLMSLCVNVPVRLYAAVTPATMKWGTRHSGVEVTSAGAAGRALLRSPAEAGSIDEY